MPSRGSSEKVTKERKIEGGEKRGSDERSICSGMHSALIALSASRIYTLLRAEPLKKPSFTLPLHETSPCRPAPRGTPFVKSRNFVARCALPVAKMDESPDTRYRRETFSDSGWRVRTRGVPFSASIAAQEFRIRRSRMESSFIRYSGKTCPVIFNLNINLITHDGYYI